MMTNGGVVFSVQGSNDPSYRRIHSLSVPRRSALPPTRLPTSLLTLPRYDDSGSRTSPKSRLVSWLDAALVLVPPRSMMPYASDAIDPSNTA